MTGQAQLLWWHARRLFRKESVSPNAPESGINYAAWIANRVRERRREYSPSRRTCRPTIDMLTLVFDTPPDILQATIRSVLNQTYDRFRWIIWDNASSRPETLAVLRELECEPRVILRRSDQNLGIVAGHAAALRHCTGEYIGLLDHDDYLYPDALAIAAVFTEHHGNPPLLYSDEDKLDQAGRAFCPFFKPAWSPALLQSTGYTCHFTLFRRELGLRLGVFEDRKTEGAQDWDLALRFMDAGYEGVHIPEVLYSWRMHAESTAGRGTEAKPYALAGQRRCLEQSLGRRGLTDRFRVVTNPLYPFVDGHWHVERIDRELPPVIARNADWQASGRDAVIAFVPLGLRSLPQHWLRQAIAQLELDPKAAMVGGRVLDADERVLIGSPVLGMKGLVGTALQGCPATEIGYFGLHLSPRNVVALQGGPWLARSVALAEVTSGFKEPLSLFEACLRLHQRGWRIVWTPHITTQAENAVDFASATVDDMLAERLAAYEPLIADDPFYGRFLSLDPKRAYQIAAPGERERQRVARALQVA
jgi:GT2 family glycosyltransferase